jgi:hypothetical protein
MSDAPESLRAPEPISAGLDKSSHNDEKRQDDNLGPTDSHVLSQVEPEEDAKGLAQKAGVTNDVSDIGWGESDKIEERIVRGLSNEDLWMLIRRFNKVCLLSSHRKEMLTSAANLLCQSCSESSITEAES